MGIPVPPNSGQIEALRGDEVRNHAEARREISTLLDLE